MAENDELLQRALRARVEALCRQVNRGFLNELDVKAAERLARVVDLRARTPSHKTRWRFAWLLIPAGGALLATVRQPSPRVRVTVEATSAKVVVDEDYELSLGLGGRSASSTGLQPVHSPPELVNLLGSQERSGISLKVDSSGIIALEQVNVVRGAELGFRSETGLTAVQVACEGTCSSNHLRLAVRGRLHSADDTVSLIAGTGLDFAVRGRRAAIEFTDLDSAGFSLNGALPINRLSLVESRFVEPRGAQVIANVSSVRGGSVTLPAYPSRNRSLARGDELQLVGPGLRLIAAERRDDVLVFHITGRASSMRLGREDLRPTWWDWVRTGPYGAIVVGFIALLSALMGLVDILRGRIK